MPAVADDASHPMTADDPAIRRAQPLIERGEFAEATRVLSDAGDAPTPEIARRRADVIEITRRIRLDYRLNDEQMLAKLRGSIPDATLDDLRRWRTAGELQHRLIDGRVWYFGREPVNLFRFSEDAKQRRDRAATDGLSSGSPAARAGFVLNDHLLELVRRAGETDAIEIEPIRHRIAYALALTPKPGRLRAGSRVRIWLPYPQVYRQQRDVKLVRTSPPVTRIAPNWDEAKHGELQRTLYFEITVDDPTTPVRAEAVYEYTCATYYPRLDAAKVRPYDAKSKLYREFTAERPPHIVFSPDVRRIVEQETAGTSNPLERARKLFAWVDGHIRYAAEVEYSTIPSLTRKALDTRKGDCGVQSMTFITLCRAAGVPARWQSGWETKPDQRNMHDWCEFYVEPWGWLPADPSYGLRESTDPRVREFYVGHMDGYRLIANLDYSSPLVPAKESFRSEPIDFQRGEVEVDGENVYFDEWDYSMRVDYVQG